MRKIELTQAELKLITHFTTLNREIHKECYSDDYEIDVLNKIEPTIKRIEKIIIKLTEMECSIISGILKSLVVEKNLSLIEKSTYEIITNNNLESNEKIELCYSTFNILTKLTGKKHNTFNKKIDILRNINNSKKIYFSKKKFKPFSEIAIEISESRGIIIKPEIFHRDRNIEVLDLTKYEFDSFLTPSDFLKDYEKYPLSERILFNDVEILNLIKKTVL